MRSSRAADTGLVDDLAGLAMALTGDRAAAATLLGDIRPAVDGSSTLTDRNRLAQLSLRRRTPAPSRPPDRDELPDGLEQVAVALDDLDPLQRTSVVLTELLALTLGEIAGLLDRSPAVIRGVRDGGLDRLGSHAYGVSAALEALSRQRPDATELRAGARRAAAARRQRRRLIVAMVVALALTLVAAVGIPLARRVADPPPYTRPPGLWAYGLDVELPEGWQVVSHWVTPTLELLALRPTIDPDLAHECNVESGFDQVGRLVRSPSPVPVVVRRLHGFAGRAEDGQPLVTLNALDGKAITVVCSGFADAEQRVLDVAGRVRYRKTPLRLPVAFTHFPVGYQLDSINVSRGEATISASHLPVSSGPWRQLFVEVPGSRPRGAGTRIPTVVDGLDAQLWVDSRDVTLCVTPQGTPVCLDAPLTSEVTDRQERRAEVAAATTELVGLGRSLRFAPRIDDQSTWFDAADVF